MSSARNTQTGFTLVTAQQASKNQPQPSLVGEASESFESIRKERFDQFRPPPLGLESLMAWQIEWFANKAGTTIGTLAKGKVTTGWDYAVLEREQTGNFRSVNWAGTRSVSMMHGRTSSLKWRR